MKQIIKKTKESIRRLFTISTSLPLGGLGWAFACGVLLTSCEDFLTIYPTDKIVGTDFWKNKDDVEGMVNGAYKSMLADAIQERAVIWGAFRSDELVKLADLSNTTLDNISAVNLLPTNGYNNWSAFYKVINNCNIVLAHAPEVMAADPEFTEGDYQTVRAQMLALRSLCYFYLVRAFRDVPLTTQSFEDDAQQLVIAQSAPAVVLQQCLDDLAEAEKYIVRTGAYGYGSWQNLGYFTRDAVNALIADIYLWRAAMTHSQSDYQQAIDYVEKVITAKDLYYQQNNTDRVSATVTDRYHLQKGETAMYMIFGYDNGNSHESILEWQYNGKDNPNYTLENLYYREGSKDSPKTYSRLMASELFNVPAANANTVQGQKIYQSRNDLRFWNNVYGANNEESAELSIRKMVDAGALTVAVTSTEGPTKTTTREFENFRQNWVVYRLTDLMLMEAEALVETASDDADQTTLKRAFDLVQVVNKRSMDMDAKDTLKFEDYNTKNAMELLVLAERERELCFEGKRWWDLMRFSYRHMTGVDANTLLADQTAWPALHPQMLRFVVRKYGEGGKGDAVSYKMKSEPFLYWPVLENEIKVNALLRQNPVYVQEKSTSKN